MWWLTIYIFEAEIDRARLIKILAELMDGRSNGILGMPVTGKTPVAHKGFVQISDGPRERFCGRDRGLRSPFLQWPSSAHFAPSHTARGRVFPPH